MSYLPPPAFLNNKNKSRYERGDTNKNSGLISIETLREDGSTYMASIRKPMVFINEPKNRSYFLIDCLFYLPEFIFRFYKKTFKE